MNKWCVGGTTVCLGTTVLLILLALCYFFFQSGSDITEKVSGNENVISNNEKKEISIFHIENLSNQLSDLEGQVTTHNTVKYGLIAGILIVLMLVMLYKCVNIKKNVKKRLRRDEMIEKG